ncbi:S-adenosyl-L-methionine-dependent methyltransferase [Collybia nuda]|uniref:S-adenosyl-L-methionine-dependent methyltransferase n=1 Tax=Collybia nuda TaxID=64659 RepID=A0A9P5YDC3_9AGAR|nr:S-adenosyl-L-methionine-dependent methyltransferase [Collybia nuda]
MTFAKIRQLLDNLKRSVDSLEELYSTHSLDFPSLDVPFSKSKAEDLARSPDAVNMINVCVASAFQILLTMRHPFETLCDGSSIYQLSSCLRIAENLNIPEIIRENNSPDCHVNDIALKCDVEPTKLARILRVLSSHHIFTETSPDKFANNRVSSFFDSGKETHKLKIEPAMKYKDSPGIAGYIGTFTDEVAKASSYLLETLKDKDHGKSFAPDHTALQMAMNTSSVYFPWLEEPSNHYRLERYADCIRGTSLWDPPDTILEGYNWSSLAPGSVVVDVGGGTGAPSMIIAVEHPSLSFVIQDREPVIAQAKEHWNNSKPDIVGSGRVSFQVHDFFKEQPQKNTAVFLVRTICHDWPDHLVTQILRNLREAASPSTQLLLGDYVIPYSCNDVGGEVDIAGAESSKVPAPLLANMGKASSNVYWIDMTMQVLLNGQERTLSHHARLMCDAGWRPVTLNKRRNSHFGYIIAECQ